jgi:hypothetical protein
VPGSVAPIPVPKAELEDVIAAIDRLAPILEAILAHQRVLCERWNLFPADYPGPASGV